MKMADSLVNSINCDCCNICQCYCWKLILKLCIETCGMIPYAKNDYESNFPCHHNLRLMTMSGLAQIVLPLFK